MWNYVIIETTFWSHRQHDVEKRKKQRKLDEEKVKTLLMKELKSLNITAQGRLKFFIHFFIVREL